MARWPTLSLQERILKHVKKAENGCWEWTGSLTCATPGWHYGRINMVETVRLAHRVSWEAFHGTLDPGFDVLHKCDNCRCVNPEHLFVGGQKENNEDRNNKGRHAHGKNHGKYIHGKYVNQARWRTRPDGSRYFFSGNSERVG